MAENAKLNSKSQSGRSGSTAALEKNIITFGCDQLLQRLHRAPVGVSLVVVAATSGWWIQMLTFYVLFDWGGRADSGRDIETTNQLLFGYGMVCPKTWTPGISPVISCHGVVEAI